MHQKRVWIGIITVLVMLLFAFQSKIIFINVTASLPLGIYVRIPATTLRTGDIVAYTPPEGIKDFAIQNGWMKGEHFYFLKKAALPGASYHVDTRFSINGKDIGPVIFTSPSGVKMPVHLGSHTVPEGCFLPYGTNQYSFDGRYEGVVPMENIIARVVPLWTYR